MRDILNFLETLIEDMEECNWSIECIVEGVKITENNKEYLNVDNSLYEKQDTLYIKQWTGCCEDDYYGVIFYPITDNKYLKINYSC